MVKDGNCEKHTRGKAMTNSCICRCRGGNCGKPQRLRKESNDDYLDCHSNLKKTSQPEAEAWFQPTTSLCYYGVTKELLLHLPCTSSNINPGHATGWLLVSTV